MPLTQCATNLLFARRCYAKLHHCYANVTSEMAQDRRCYAVTDSIESVFATGVLNPFARVLTGSLIETLRQSRM